jgi:hypothetical protein
MGAFCSHWYQANGFLEGRLALPMYALWFVKLELFLPRYDAAAAAEDVFPAEANGRFVCVCVCVCLSVCVSVCVSVCQCE